MNSKDNIWRGKIDDGEKKAVAARKIKEVKDLLAPYGSVHLGSVCLHFYSTIEVFSGKESVSIVTQPVDVSINPALVKTLIPEIRDRILEALGGQQMKLSPKTVEETKDLGLPLIGVDRNANN